MRIYTTELRSIYQPNAGISYQANAVSNLRADLAAERALGISETNRANENAGKLDQQYKVSAEYIKRNVDFRAALAAERAAHADDAKELNRLNHLIREESNARERAEAQLKLSQEMHARAAERAKRSEAQLANVQRANMRQMETVQQAREAQYWAQGETARVRSELTETRAQVERLRGLIDAGIIKAQKCCNHAGAMVIMERFKQALADTAPTHSGICDTCGKQSDNLTSVNMAPMANASICEKCQAPAKETEGLRDRTHEECADCAHEKTEPQPCKGHCAGESPCGQFKSAAPTTAQENLK